jgi:hypothetical protein
MSGGINLLFGVLGLLKTINIDQIFFLWTLMLELQKQCYFDNVTFSVKLVPVFLRLLLQHLPLLLPDVISLFSTIQM